MLTISPAQMAAFQGLSDDEFHARLFAFLCEEFPEHAADRGGVAAVVEVGVSDARDAGLRGERAIAIYVMIAFLMGMEVKDDPRFIANVRESGASEGEKIAWMEGWIDAVAAALDS
jgi:hypothetical protein